MNGDRTEASAVGCAGVPMITGDDEEEGEEGEGDACGPCGREAGEEPEGDEPLGEGGEPGPGLGGGVGAEDVGRGGMEEGSHLEPHGCEQHEGYYDRYEDWQERRRLANRRHGRMVYDAILHLG